MDYTVSGIQKRLENEESLTFKQAAEIEVTMGTTASNAVTLHSRFTQNGCWTGQETAESSHKGMLSVWKWIQPPC